MYALNLTSFETMAIYGVLVIAVLSLVYAFLLYRNVMAEDKGTEAMIRIWTAIKDGADAYLSSQLKTILPFVAILVFVLFASAWIAPPTPAAMKMYGDNAQIIIAFGRAGAFRPGRDLLADGRPVRHAHGRAGQHPRGVRRDAQLR